MGEDEGVRLCEWEAKGGEVVSCVFGRGEG